MSAKVEVVRVPLPSGTPEPLRFGTPLRIVSLSSPGEAWAIRVRHPEKGGSLIRTPTPEEIDLWQQLQATKRLLEREKRLRVYAGLRGLSLGAGDQRRADTYRLETWMKTLPGWFRWLLGKVSFLELYFTQVAPRQSINSPSTVKRWLNSSWRSFGGPS